MIVHELATNAAKYGALSVPTGRVKVSWSLSKTNSIRIGEFDWKEEGGPVVERPSKTGFGSELIKLSAADLGGKCEIMPETSGFRCTFGLRFEGRGADT
jgi:two-component sensor histidine kinase